MLGDRNMEIVEEYFGYWYLPDENDKKVYGILKVFKNNNFKLELCGVLGKRNSDFKNNNIKVINGFSKKW